MLFKKNQKKGKETVPAERCVACGSLTQYTHDTPINSRIGYIDGCGQLCKQCSAAFRKLGHSETSIEEVARIMATFGNKKEGD